MRFRFEFVKDGFVQIVMTRGLVAFFSADARASECRKRTDPRDVSRPTPPQTLPTVLALSWPFSRHVCLGFIVGRP